MVPATPTLIEKFLAVIGIEETSLLKDARMLDTLV